MAHTASQISVLDCSTIAPASRKSENVAFGDGEHAAGKIEEPGARATGADIDADDVACVSYR